MANFHMLVLSPLSSKVSWTGAQRYVLSLCDRHLLGAHFLQQGLKARSCVYFHGQVLVP